ncbi:MAG TPA: hypothetical protein PLT09_13715 [Deltaproteobacteria bacterium]|nr:hypothetical protein [Deltaproteobacteria bacterium]
MDRKQEKTMFKRSQHVSSKYVCGLVVAIIVLAAIGAAPRPALCGGMNAAQVLAHPEMLHKRIKAGNPEYNDQAQFAQVKNLGLVGDFTGSRISDLSPLAGIPFNALDLRGQPISDLRPLKIMPLTFLGIEDTKVADVSPLTGMRLSKLYLSNTPVSDLRPLASMPLNELMLVGTRVHDLEPLRGSPVGTLWLNNTPVSDIAPLSGCRLVSLTLEGTNVADLTPLAKMTSLKRLNIGRTPVTDLTPLKGLKLERLVFTPGSIRKGLDAARNMKTLTEVGTTLDALMPPQEFWKRYDGKQ